MSDRITESLTMGSLMMVLLGICTFGYTGNIILTIIVSIVSLILFGGLMYSIYDERID